MSRAKLAAITLLIFLGGALVAAILPGCTRDPRDQLRFMIWGSPDEIKVVQGFLEEFRSAHPEIKVRVEHAPSMGYREKLRILCLGGNAPDVMYMGEADLPFFAEQGHILDLTELVERDAAEIDPADFFPETFERFRHRGKLYGICKDFATLVLYYNKDLFDKWEVPYPQAGWTWAEFLETAQALTREGDYGFLLETWPEELFPWIWQAGGEIAREDPPEWLMGKPEYLEQSAEGLQFLSDLIWKHKVTPGPSVTRDQTGNALFLRGQAAMCTYGRWACMEFRHIKDFDWDCVELPRHRRQATSTFTVAYAIGAKTHQPEEAWTLVKFLTSKARQEAVAHSAQAIPSRKSVATGQAFVKPAALSILDYPVAAHPHTDQVPHGRFSPRFKTAPEAKEAFGRAAEALWNGTRRDAKQVLLEVQPALETIVARSRDEAPAPPGE